MSITTHTRNVGRIAVAMACLILSGCGSIITLTDLDQEGTRHGLIYGGVRFDGRGVFDWSYLPDNPEMKLFCVLDMPLSLASDTVLLPVTLGIECKRALRTDERLYGTWKPDLTRTLQEYHRVYDSSNLSKEVEEMHIGRYGKQMITFSRFNMVLDREGKKTAYSYRVVDSGTKNVVIRWRTPTRYNEFIEISFESHGLWYTPQSWGEREFYRRQTDRK